MTRLLLIERFLRICCFTLLGVLLVLVLTACGPGSGGTGTGPISFTNVSSGSTSDGGASEVPSPAPGPLGSCGRVDLQLQEGRVEVVTRCGSFVFVGDWGVGPDGQVALPGTLENPSVGSIRAVLRMQFSGTPEDSSSVIVTVTDEAGQVLVGPEVLGRVESLPPRLPG